MEAFPIAGLAL
jgi:hypothetical protein